MKVTDPAIKPAVYPTINKLTAWATDSTEVDASGNLTVANTSVTATNVSSGDSTYAYETFPANHFTGNFTLENQINVAAISNDTNGYGIFTVGSNIGTAAGIIGAGGNLLGLGVNSTGAQAHLYIGEISGGAVNSSSNINISTATNYWVRFYKSGGTGYIYVYSDVDYSTAVGNTTLVLNDQTDTYTYLYWFQCLGLAADTITCTVSNGRYWRGA